MQHSHRILVLLTTLALAAGFLGGCADSPAGPGDSGDPDSTAVPARWTYRVVAEYPHDPTAFTQGLVMRDGRLYEGTGIRGESTLREVDLETGTVLRSTNLDSRFFGEGVTVLGDRVLQLTWQAHRGFVYNLDDFASRGGFEYAGEGWGLTDDGTVLYLSDGTHTIRVLDPDTFAVLRTITVYRNSANGERLLPGSLNELEFIDGEIYANVWHTNLVARISPDTGVVLGYIDFTGLLSQDDCPNLEVLNGIAYDAEKDRLFVTGKRWCTLFEVEILPETAAVGR